ncbi:uncharacterized protein LOC142894233 [Nelusetta ayraudi]|uniref:uncharacterized protein LOC142894233 n=1 Tax=Nelusetta ayraudi TaxID=303726 RepID=UPI003F6FEC6E
MELSYRNPPNISLSRPHESSANSSQGLFLNSCFNTAPSSSIFTTFTITNILLLLPLSLYILHTGFQRWRKDGSREPMNPTDVFTYHMVAMELFGISGSVVCSCGAFLDHPMMLWVGCNMFAIISCIKMFFHVLTCVERYVAVVHPMTYMSLSKDGGITMRNISIGCVWLICAGLVALKILITQNFIVILFFCNLVLSLAVSSFCSISVLRVLLRLGPAEEGSNAGKVDKMKQRAFVTITAIMAVLLMRFSGNLVCLALAASSLLSYTVGCVVRAMGIWFCLPSSYVLPLLFLHRAEKIVCFKYSSEAD